MKRINLTATFTIAGVMLATLENNDGQGVCRQLAIDPSKTVTETLKDLNLIASKATLDELIKALASAPTLVEDPLI